MLPHVQLNVKVSNKLIQSGAWYRFEAFIDLFAFFSGGAGGGEGALFLRALSVTQIFVPESLRQKNCAKKFFFPIFDFILGAIHLRKKA